MANRRMFSKTITSSSRFLMMSLTAQALYFHLGMNADDDGFCEHFAIMRMVEAKPDDLRILQAKGFIEIFDEKILIVKDWGENNYIRADRYQRSKYLEEYKNEVALLSQDKSGIPDGNQRLTEVRLGKVRLDTSESEDSQDISFHDLEDEKPKRKKADTEYRKIFELWGKYPANWKQNRTEIQSAKNLLEEHGIDNTRKALNYAVKNKMIDFCPQITKPSDLDRKWADLTVFKDKGRL